MATSNRRKRDLFGELTEGVAAMRGEPTRPFRQPGARMKQRLKRPTHYTGAAGTLAVAAELSRRNYDAAITLGNTPALDIICASPGGRKFTVQVKSVSAPNWVRIRKDHMEVPDKDLYFVIVLVPNDPDLPFVFHVLAHVEVCDNYKGQAKKRADGKDLVPGFEGVPWSFVKPFLGGWKKLPP